MAFPTTGLLDAFTGAGPTTPPSANWTTYAGISSAALRLIGSQVDSNSATLAGNGIWNPTTFGPDSEAWVTVDTKPVTTDFIRLYARVNTVANDFYAVQVTGANVWTWRKNVAGVNTALAGTVTTAWSAGDKLGFEVIGNTLSAYLFTGGAWTLVLTTTDVSGNPVTAAGNIGVTATKQTNKINDFGGGTVVVAAPDGPHPIVSPRMSYV